MELDHKTCDLLDKVFREGEIIAKRDGEKTLNKILQNEDESEDETSECPYEHDELRRWWLRGYHSQNRMNVISTSVLGRPKIEKSI